MTSAHVLRPGASRARPPVRRLAVAPGAGAARPAAASVWWARIADDGPGAGEQSLVAVHSTRFADGTAVDMTAIPSRGRRPLGWLVDLRFRPSDGSPLHVRTGDGVVPGRPDGTTPPLWFAEVHHATSLIPATSLFAFPGTGFAPGSVVTPREVAARGVRMGEQVGELRWQNRSGLVDSVAVVPGLRRRGIATELVTVAEALRMLRGWPPLRSDGRLTDAATAWLATAPAPWRPRLAARSAVLPDADLDDGPTGVARLLR